MFFLVHIDPKCLKQRLPFYFRRVGSSPQWSFIEQARHSSSKKNKP